jgi:hypothetical protein
VGRIVRRYTAAYGLHWFEEVDVAVSYEEATREETKRRRLAMAEVERKIDEALIAGQREVDASIVPSWLHTTVISAYGLVGWDVALVSGEHDQRVFRFRERDRGDIREGR